MVAVFLGLDIKGTTERLEEFKVDVGKVLRDHQSCISKLEIGLEHQSELSNSLEDKLKKLDSLHASDKA